MKEALFYKQEGKNGVVRCSLCARRCLIPEGKRGFCMVRENTKGRLYSLVYGKICSANLDPVEKKPLYHFWPGSTAFSISTVGCNFRCKFCCNWQISHSKEIFGEDMTPEQVVERAKSSGARMISYTYTEPTIFFEFAYDTARLAKKEGLLNTFVTNGYTTPEAIRKIAPYLDAATVDFKASGNPKFYKEYASVPDVGPIFEALLEYRKQGVFLEITDLLVPGIGDSSKETEKLVDWIIENLGTEAPLHFLRFYPAGMMMDVPFTPPETIENARKMAMTKGMKYVYSGNTPSMEGESTRCPSCGKVVIGRSGFSVTELALGKGNTCQYCGWKVAIVGTPGRQNLFSTRLG